METEKNLLEFSGPCSYKVTEISSSITPGKTPFDDCFNEAFMFNNDCSMQLLDDSFLKNMDYGRESLLFSDVQDIGRESLGILNLESLNVTNFNEEDDNFLHTINFNGDYKSTVAIRKPSASSAATSYASLWPSFNSNNFSGSVPSTIFSINSPTSIKDIANADLFNQAFINSPEKKISFNLSNLPTKSSSIHFKCIDPLLGKFRLRVQSLPEFLNVPSKSIENYKTCKKEEEIEKSIVDLSKQTSFIVDNDDTENEFNESVFIEANHVASKIADGSIWNEEEADYLDCTPQPEWDSFQEMDKAEDGNVKYDKETVFKTIDKMLPPTTIKKEDDLCSDSNLKLDEVKCTNNKCDNLFKNSDDQIFNINLSNISHANKESLQNNLESSQKQKLIRSNSSQSIKEILQNLSEILKNDNRSDSQKSEGRNLIFSLSEMLCSQEKTNNTEDSGHSSSAEVFNEEEQNQPTEQDIDYFEVLDLRTKSVSSDDAVKPIDLSMKMKTNGTPNKRLSQSFSFPKLDRPKTVKVDKSNVKSVSSNDENNMSNQNTLNKLRPKKIDTKATKGPLKAVIPLGVMTKKFTSKISTPLLQNKKTNIPVCEPKLPKPVAQSTPEDKSKYLQSISSKKDKFNYLTSPLARPRSASFSSRNSFSSNSRSDSAPNLTNSRNSTSGIPLQNTSLRKSFGDIKSTSQTTEKNAKLISSIGKIKENISKSNLIKRTSGGNLVNKTSVERSSNVLKENRRGSFSGAKPCNLFAKLKKGISIEKENIE